MSLAQSEAQVSRAMLSETASWDRRFVWFLLVVSASALGYILFLSPGLFPDEAYFWDLSRRLQLGYVEKPPLVNYLIRTTTAFFGDTELGVRFGAVLCFAAFSALAYALGRRVLDNARDAFVATALLTLTPMSAAARTIITPDSLLIVAWTLILYGCHEALLRSRSLWGWGLVSTGLAVGLMAKQTTILALPCLAGCLAATPEFRCWLRRPAPYLAVGLGMLGLGPLLIWNALNGWATVRHMLWQAHASEGLRVNLVSFANFVGSQLLLLSPLLWIGLLAGMVWAGIRGILGTSPVDAFLFWFSAPIIGFFLVKSVQGNTLGNWAAVAYIAGAYAMIRWFRATLAVAASPWKARLRHLAWTTAGIAVAFMLLAHDVSALAMLGIRQAVALDPLKEGMGWREVGRAAGDAYAALSKERPAVLMARRYQVASELAFYTPGRPDVYNINWGRRQNQYDLWEDLRTLVGVSAVFVDLHDPHSLSRLLTTFESCDRWPPIEIHRYGVRVRTFTVFACRGYRGPDTPGARLAEGSRRSRGRDAHPGSL